MRKVWNEADQEFEYLADEEETGTPIVAPVMAKDGPEEIKARVAEIMEKGEALSQQERNRRWRESNPEKYRQYRLNYMTRYRARRKAE